VEETAIAYHAFHRQVVSEVLRTEEPPDGVV
jgi:hypothetical protein